jgi:hypothetical protein
VSNEKYYYYFHVTKLRDGGDYSTTPMDEKRTTSLE